MSDPQKWSGLKCVSCRGGIAAPPWCPRASGTLALCVPSVTWSPGAQSQPSTEHLLPAGFPQHTMCMSVPDFQVAVHMASFIKSAFPNVSTSYSYSRRNMKVWAKYQRFMHFSLVHHPSGQTYKGNSESVTERNYLPFDTLCPLSHGNTV